MMVKLFVLALSSMLCSVTANPKRPSDPNTSTCSRNCDLEDYDCIRGRFDLNKHCAVQDNHAKAPARFVVPRTRQYAPNFDISIIDHNTVFTGLDKCKIVEFCYNKTSGEHVTGIFCPLIRFKSDRTVYLHRTVKVDQVYQSPISAIYVNITLTTIRHRRYGWDLCWHSDTLTTFSVTPEYHILSDDKAIRKLGESHVYPPGVFDKELFHTIGPLLAHKYINSVFCDFGCN